MRADWGTTEFVVVDTGGLMNTSQRLPASLAVKDVRGLGDSNLPEVCSLCILQKASAAS